MPSFRRLQEEMATIRRHQEEIREGIDRRDGQWRGNRWQAWNS